MAHRFASPKTPTKYASQASCQKNKVGYKIVSDDIAFNSSLLGREQGCYQNDIQAKTCSNIWKWDWGTEKDWAKFARNDNVEMEEWNKVNLRGLRKLGIEV